MKKKAITKMVLGAGIGALTGVVAYKIIKDYKENKFIKNLRDEYEENQDESRKEDMFYERTYTKLK